MTYYVNAYAVIFDNDNDEDTSNYEGETQFVYVGEERPSFTHDLSFAKERCKNMQRLFPHINYRVVKITMEEIL